MGMDLYGRQGYYRFTQHEWNHVMRLGVHYGWEPAGTRLGRNELRRCRARARRAGKTPAQIARGVRRLVAGFHGDYWCNEQQAVTAADARALADALERALPHTPTVDLLKRGATFPRTAKGASDYFGGRDGRCVLAGFIAYCRKGRFEIW